MTVRKEDIELREYGYAVYLKERGLIYYCFTLEQVEEFKKATKQKIRNIYKTEIRWIKEIKLIEKVE